jgi:hypothetical protein
MPLSEPTGEHPCIFTAVISALRMPICRFQDCRARMIALALARMAELAWASIRPYRSGSPDHASLGRLRSHSLAPLGHRGRLARTAGRAQRLCAGGRPPSGRIAYQGGRHGRGLRQAERPERMAGQALARTRDLAMCPIDVVKGFLFAGSEALKAILDPGAQSGGSAAWTSATHAQSWAADSAARTSCASNSSGWPPSRKASGLAGPSRAGRGER